MKTYSELIEEEATDFINEHKEKFLEVIKENIDRTEDYIFSEAIYQDEDLNSMIHEWLDSSWYSFMRDDAFKDFNTEFTTCAIILEWSKEVETDSGLWENQEPKEAISTQAFFSVRNDLYRLIEDKLKELISETVK